MYLKEINCRKEERRIFLYLGIYKSRAALKFNKRKVLNNIAIISGIGMFGWIITAFFGGMYIYLLTYGFIIVPIIILYNISFIDTFISLLKRGVQENKMKTYMHGAIVAMIIALVLFQSDLFKSKRVYTATLKIDPFLYTLILRNNGICESEAFSMLGYKEFYRGKYKFYGDTIVFQEKPDNLGFIPDTMLLVKNDLAIYYDRDGEGNFIKFLDWPDHFDIQ
jgi:hypothetical protein